MQPISTAQSGNALNHAIYQLQNNLCYNIVYEKHGDNLLMWLLLEQNWMQTLINAQNQTLISPLEIHKA